MSGQILRITDDVINKMLSDPVLKKHFPFLENPPTKRVGKTRKRCGGCSGGARTKVRTVVHTQALRRRLGTMSDNQIAQLKELLGVKQIRVSFRERKKGKKRVVDKVR